MADTSFVISHHEGLTAFFSSTHSFGGLVWASPNSRDRLTNHPIPNYESQPFFFHFHRIVAVVCGGRRNAEECFHGTRTLEKGGPHEKRGRRVSWHFHFWGGRTGMGPSTRALPAQQTLTFPVPFSLSLFCLFSFSSPFLLFFSFSLIHQLHLLSHPFHRTNCTHAHYSLYRQFTLVSSVSISQIL